MMFMSILGGSYKKSNNVSFKHLFEMIGLILFDKIHINVMFIMSIDPSINYRHYLVIEVGKFNGVRILV